MAQKKKASKKSKMIVDANVDNDPVTGSNEFTTLYQGRIAVLDPNKSEVAKKMGFTMKGDYAIKIRG